MITPHGVRKQGNWCPHNKSFPAIISALKALMGLEQKVYQEDGWMNDYDYFFQMGVSAEGFGLLYGMESILKAGLWKNEALNDSLLSEGFLFRLEADKHIPFKDEELNPETIKEKITCHLQSDLPVILIHDKYSNLVVGFDDYGNTLYGPAFGMGKSFTAKNNKARPHKNWQNKLHAVVFIEGITEPIVHKEVFLRALQRGYEMLTETQKVMGEYGYGNAMWEKWKNRFNDDTTFTKESHACKYIDPEKFDLAERRAYTQKFFAQAEEYLGESCLQNAQQAFTNIHNKMWDIHWMVKGENKGKLLEHDTRKKVMAILQECQELDHIAAKNIKQVLDKYQQPAIVKFDNHVNVFGADGQPQNSTYLRRAKGLVKKERAEWIDEKAIRILDSSDKTDEPEKINETYHYHCQHQAETFAKGIIAVPKNYPLQAGLPKDFQLHFAKLCDLAKNIYMDMARQPESYGLMLIDIESQDHNLSRDGYRTIHRFVDTLSNLSYCGELKNHQLIVNAEEFKKSIKKGTGLVSGPIPRYELIFSRLVKFGFSISDFDGKPFNKKVEFFTVEYPSFPVMIDTIKAYCDCWKSKQKEDVKIWQQEYHHHYYRFDYKITADRKEIPMLQWISDEADYLGYSPEQKAFSIAFYEYSLQYKDVKFNGDYTYKSKRIARIFQDGYIAMGTTEFLLHIKIKDMDKYIEEIHAMPEIIKKAMTKDSCRHCNFQGATADHCKFRLHWTFNEQSYLGCSHACFYFNDFDIAHIPNYWRLLELEYNLKKV